MWSPGDVLNNKLRMGSDLIYKVFHPWTVNTWKEVPHGEKKGQKAAVAIANKILNIGYALCKSRSTYSYEGCETELRRKLKNYGLETIAGTNTNSAAEVTRPTN